jgi:transcriptional regulator with XRE-family HTH domain
MKQEIAAGEPALQTVFAERLKKSRSVAGLSLPQAEAASGVAAAVIEKYEGGRTLAPNAFVVGRLASAYSVSTDYLLGLTEEDDLPSGTFVVHQHVVDAVRVAHSAKDLVNLIEWTPTFIPFWDVVGANRRVSSKSEIYALSLELETKVGSLAPELVNSYMQGLLTMMDLRDEATRNLGE